MDSVRNANIDRVMTFALAGAGVRYRETGDLTTENNRVLVDAFANDGHPLVVEDSVSGSDHLFSGTWLINGEPGVVESSADNVQFLDAWSNLPLVLPDDNDVRLFRSDFPSLDGSPKTENYVGSAAGTASTPDAGGWDPGDVVFWTDEDGDDDGVYLRGRDQTWTEIGEVQ